METTIQKQKAQEEQQEHGHIKREVHKGKSDKKITEFKARQEEALHFAQT
jgi:hypothetical protein